MKPIRLLLLGMLLFCHAAFAQKAIVVGYTAVPDFAAAFIAKERGFFEKRRLQVELQPVNLTSNVPFAIHSNSIQIGGTTTSVWLQALDGGLDLMALAGGSRYDNTKGYVNIVARTESRITTATQLVGKKFGVPGLGGALHVLVRRWLIEKGVDPRQVTFIEVRIDQLANVLAAGSIDAAVTGEPFVGRLVQAGTASIVPGFSTETPGGISLVLYVADRKWANENAVAVKAFREALAEAIAFADSHRDEAYADLSKYFKLPAAVMKSTPWPTLTVELSEPQIQFWIQTMRRQDMLKNSPGTRSMLFQ